jgi:DNA-binding NtrC family response regulator
MPHLSFRIPERNIRMRKPKLLIVDDDKMLNHNMSWLLSRKGYEVSSANDGESALQMVENQDFDVVILDQKMPGMDGVTTLRELKKKRPNLEVIILTGASSVDSAVKGFEFGAYDYTTKPMQMDVLEEKVMQAFERKLLLE